MKKITKREKFEMLMAIEEVRTNEMLVEFIQNELNLLARKNSGERKPTANQVLNEGIKDAIYEFLGDGNMYTISDLIKLCPACADMSNQRVNALVRQMVPDRIDRVEYKRKAYFCRSGLAEEMEVGE